MFNPEKFEAKVIPRYFSTSKLSSFNRQLNLYGFRRLTKGEILPVARSIYIIRIITTSFNSCSTFFITGIDAGAWHHPYFYHGAKLEDIKSMVGLKNAKMTKEIESSLAKANELSTEKESDPSLTQTEMDIDDEPSTNEETSSYINYIQHQSVKYTSQYTPSATPTRAGRNSKPKIDQDFQYESEDESIVSLNRKQKPGRKKKTQLLQQYQYEHQIHPMDQQDIHDYPSFEMNDRREEQEEYKEEAEGIQEAEQEQGEGEELGVSNQLMHWENSDLTTISPFPRSYSREEIDMEIYDIFCANEK